VTYGGDSGNRIFVLYWRCSLIRVSVIRGSTVYISFSWAGVSRDMNHHFRGFLAEKSLRNTGMNDAHSGVHGSSYYLWCGPVCVPYREEDRVNVGVTKILLVY
jgi:hypothetical protein